VFHQTVDVDVAETVDVADVFNQTFAAIRGYPTNATRGCLTKPSSRIPYKPVACVSLDLKSESYPALKENRIPPRFGVVIGKSRRRRRRGCVQPNGRRDSWKPSPRFAHLKSNGIPMRPARESVDTYHQTLAADVWKLAKTFDVETFDVNLGRASRKPST
jgi:hypothetical protein